MTNETYNGWANWQTWNVALWIQNHFDLYAVALMAGSYEEFLEFLPHFESDLRHHTPDGAEWHDPAIDVLAINQMIEEF